MISYQTLEPPLFTIPVEVEAVQLIALPVKGQKSALSPTPCAVRCCAKNRRGCLKGRTVMRYGRCCWSNRVMMETVSGKLVVAFR
jgi:hypothetical protein